ncbi:MAG: site-specific DNA-methyltransferase [Candidatus Portiera sp.]|nr:site-specific DNA-methyltransferase [Portiera sp.]
MTAKNKNKPVINPVIKNCDCLKLLKGLEDNSIGHINCDPPYNIGYDGGDEWDSFATEQEYLDWCKQWIEECVRVLKPQRMMCIWGTQKSDTFLRLKLDLLNSIQSLHSQSAIHWSYNWGGRSKTNFAHKFETAWCYSKGNHFYFNAEEIRIKRKMPKNIRTGEPYTNGTIPTTIWEGNLSTISKEGKGSNFHPTVKPQFVLQRMIKAYCPPDEKVLDLFSGSGSTAIACIATDREFIGSEINKEYYRKSKERIKKHQGSLFT